MQYNITKPSHGSYGVIDLNGCLTGEFLQGFWRDVTEFTRANNIKKILIDFRKCTHNISVLNQYEIAYRRKTVTDYSRIVRYAGLVKPEDHSFDFIETLEINNGHMFRIFRNMQTAQDFLEHPLPHLV